LRSGPRGPTVSALPQGEELTIGEVEKRTGVATSALRFYEAEELIHARRTAGGQRRFARDKLRRVSFIRVAQQVGLSLEEIGQALASLPEHRTPTEKDWQLRDKLDGCIGCGCLSLRHCRLLNPGDHAGERGPGPRYVLEDDAASA